MMNKKTIVFDFGGVVFHWHPPRLLQREIPHVAVDEASALHWAGEFFQNYGGDWGHFDRGTVSTDELVKRIATRTGLAAADVQRVVDGVPRELQPQADTVALMQRLRHAGHRLCYLSNMPAPYADHLEAAHPFMAWFDGGVFSSRVQHNKPEPAIYHHAAQRFAAAPADMVFIDDLLPNVQAAQALGWNALQFHSAAQVEADLLAAGWVQSVVSGGGSSPSVIQASSKV
jgi:HAD superfamily hydrolase (TIGR01509 family)